MGKEAPQKNVKLTAAYVPLRDALTHRWTGLTRKQTKELNPAVVFSVLGVYHVSLADYIVRVGADCVARQRYGNTRPHMVDSSRKMPRQSRNLNSSPQRCWSGQMSTNRLSPLCLATCSSTSLRA